MPLRLHWKTILQVGVVCLIATGTAGCSITLASITALDESRARHEARIHLDELDELEPGTNVRIFRVDGTSVVGDYVAIRQVRGKRTLQIDQQDQTMAVPFASVSRVERQRKQHSIWPALAFGGVIDAAILAVFLTTDIGAGVQLNF